MSIDQDLVSALRASTTHVGTMVDCDELRDIKRALEEAIDRMERVEEYKAGGVMMIVSCVAAIALARRALSHVQKL